MERNATTELAVTAQPALAMRPQVYLVHVQYHSKHLFFLHHLQFQPDVDVFIRDMHEIRTTM